MITVKTTQQESHNSYSVGSCNPINSHQSGSHECDWNIYPGEIEVRDWKYDSKSCFNDCPEIIFCSGLNPSICPKINGDVNVRWDHEEGPPSVLCSYPLDNFNKIKNIEIFHNKWGKNDDYNEKIMPYFCSQIVKTCPENTENSRFASCSRFVSNGTDGELCREWIKENPKLSDAAVVNYCTAHATEDCSCVSSVTYDVCDKHHCVKSSYLSTTAIKEKMRSCIIPNDIDMDDVDIDDKGYDIKRTVPWTLIILILLALLIIVVIIAFGYKYHDRKFFGFSKEEL